MEVESKALICLFFLAFSGYSLSIANPYISKDINNFAFMGDIVSTSTLFIGLLSFSLEDYIRTMTVFIIISANVIFLTMFMIKMLSVYKKKIISIFGSLPMMNSKLKCLCDKMETILDIKTWMTKGGKNEERKNFVKAKFLNSNP